jgi:hypothetical protein
VQAARQDKGGLVASAVNLAFSIELYLKALRMADGHPPSRHHHLDDLYAELPRKRRASIEKAYKSEVDTRGRVGYATSIAMSITHRDASAEERAGMHVEPTDETLPTILKRSRNVFEAWRYLHEQGEPGRVKRLLYEFHCLGVAADVLREHALRATEAMPGGSTEHG